MERTKEKRLAQQVYERFMGTVSAGRYIAWEDLPPIFSGAWIEAVEVVANRAAEVVRENGPSDEALAKAVEGIAK